MGVEALRAIAQTVQDFMDSGPPLLPSLVYFAVASVPVVLWHELGHAAMAIRRLDESVEVSVGTTGKLAELHLGKIEMTINALALPGSPAGAAEVDASRATARDVLLIALAGPGMSLVGVALSAWALAAVPRGVVHDLLWACTAAGIVGVLNAIPFELEHRRGRSRSRSDGRLALDAARAIQGLS